MSLTGCTRCLKYVVFTTNFIVWVTGMAVLGVSIWLRMDPRIEHVVRAGYADHINVYYVLCYLLISTGGVMTFVGFLGCCGAFQESKCMLATFFVFLFIIFIVELAIGVWILLNKSALEETALTTFKRLIVKDYVGTGTLREKAVDFVQKEMSCCGLDGPSDWFLSTFDRADILSRQRVPRSCCRTDRRPEIAAESLSPELLCGVADGWRNGAHPQVWPTGCRPKLVTFTNGHLEATVVLSACLAGSQLVSMLVSLLLCCLIHSSSAGGYKQ